MIPSMLPVMKQTIKVSLETVLGKDKLFKKMAATIKNFSFTPVHGSAFFLVALCLIISPIARAETSALSLSRKNTNIAVSSSDLEPFSINEKSGIREEQTVFYSDDKVNMDINEDSEPNLNLRF